MRIISATVASILLTACATPHDPMPVIDTAAVPSAFLTGNRLSVEGDDLWWRGFDDPRLDAIIERALSDNLTIAAARDRLRAARAAVLAERADRVPSISGDIGIDGTGGVSDRLNASPAGGGGGAVQP